MAAERVCCITVFNTPNYGTVLQGFALQTAVESLGHEYTVLNYFNKEQELKFSFWGSTEYMDIKYKIAKKVCYPLRVHQLKPILAFQNAYLHLSRRIWNKSELNAILKEQDVFITGSDQVWNNQEINHFDDTYFLAFAKNKRRVAYAASFGKTYNMLTEKDIKFYKEEISNIDYIGLREKSGQEIIQRVSNKKAQVVCDPVYLLTKEQWEKYCEDSSISRYIFVYLIGNGINLDVNKKIIEKAKKLAKKRKLKLIVVGVGLTSVLYGANKTPSVTQWLGYIKNAEMIISNSFHGTAFSTIFEKKFVSFVSGNADNRMNTRLYDLLSFLKLESRLFNIEESIDIVDEDINYMAVRDRIQMFREESFDFLKKAISFHETEKSK